MPEERRTWHHGLIARWWAEFNLATPELAFYHAMIERFGQPALDLGCGTGRLLLPLLRSGLDVEGCDVSEDMLTLCRERAARDGLAPRLFAQASDMLDLPRTYRTIYICDSLGTVGSPEAFGRCFRHLAPGGALVFNAYMPYAEADRWQQWSAEHRSALPEPWPERGERRRTSTGDEIELRSRRVGFDPLEQRWTREIRATLTRDGALVATEEHTMVERVFLRNELLALLRLAGFGDVAIYGGYGGTAPQPDDRMLVFIAVA